MKKLLLFTPIVITTIFVLTLPSWANNCPSIPKETKEITVKNHDATLRTESKKTSEKGSSIFKGDKLGVIDNKPTQDSEGKDYCWYKVKFLKGSDAKQYWIASIGLVEFSSWSISPSPTTTPSDSPTPGGISTPSSENKFSMLWVAWGLASIGIVVSLLAYYEKIKRSGRLNNPSSQVSVNFTKTDNLSSSNPDTTIINTDGDIASLEKSVHLIESITQEYLPQIVELIEENTEQDEEIREPESEVKAEVNKLKDEKGSFTEVSNKESMDNKIENKEDLAEKFYDNYYCSPISTTILGSDNQIDKKEYKKLVDEFNERKKDYFVRLRPQFLKLTDEFIYRGSRPTPVQLVSAHENEAPYLKIEADQENWLFPNIFSTHFHKIIISLKPSIFIIDYNLNDPRLIKPAKLKEVSSGLWEIAEIGEFET